MKTITIFVYGTLSFDQVISALLGRTLRGRPGCIRGFKRIRIKDKRYPGLVAVDNDLSVAGMVHMGITSEESKLLDTFEDDFYQKVRTEIRLDNGDDVQAFVYILPLDSMKFATKEEWDRETFEKSHLSEYIEMVKRFRQDYLAGQRNSQEF